MNGSSLLDNIEVVEADRSIWKIVAVVLAAALAAGLASFFLRKGLFIYAGLFGLFFLIIFILQNLFIKSLDKLFLAALVEVGSLALPFYRNLFGYFFVVLILVVLLFFKASLASRRELEATIRIRFFRIARLSINSALPALLLFWSVMIFSYSGFLTEKNLALFLRPFTPLIEKYIPGFSFSAPAGELLEKFVLANLSEAEAKELEKLPSPVRSQIIKKSVTELKLKVENLAGGRLNWEKPAADNIYDIFQSWYGNSKAFSKAIFIGGVLLLFFSVIRGMVPFIFPLIALLAFIFYELLLATNFCLVQLEPRSREIIILK